MVRVRATMGISRALFMVGVLMVRVSFSVLVDKCNNVSVGITYDKVMFSVLG